MHYYYVSYDIIEYWTMRMRVCLNQKECIISD